MVTVCITWSSRGSGDNGPGVGSGSFNRTDGGRDDDGLSSHVGASGRAVSYGGGTCGDGRSTSGEDRGGCQRRSRR